MSLSEFKQFCLFAGERSRLPRRLPFCSSLLFIAILLAAPGVVAQTQQQYVYGSVPVTTATSQVAGSAKNSPTGALIPVPGSPFADKLQGGPVAIDGQGHFLFIVNPPTNNISMFQIDQATGSLTEVPGSPFSTGPTENPQMAPMSPVCLAAEKSGNFLYVGYQFGNFPGQGAVNEYLIDTVNRQLVPLPGQPTTNIRSSPIGILTDARGSHLYVGLGTNLGTGVTDAGALVYSIDATTGQLIFVGSAGDAISNGLSIAIDPKGRFFFDGWAATQGVIDSALISPADGTASLPGSRVNLPLNVFPFAMLSESSGKFLYVQQADSAFVYSIDQTTGKLTQTLAALPGLSFSSGSAAADPLGPYLYSSRPDGIHGFLIDSQTGALSEIPGSPFPTGAAAQGKLTITGAPIQALSGPVAALFPSAESFGTVTLGQTSSSHLVTLTNTGDQGLALNALTLTGANPADFAATPTANCAFPTVIAANATCTIIVSFAPTVAGLRQANLAASDNAPGSPQSIPLSGTGVAPQSAVTLTPGSLSFPTTPQGTISTAQSVTVTSAGSAALHISSVLLSGSNPADFSMTYNCSGAYAINATCSISVTFSPLGAGQRLASIVITDDAPDSPQSVPLSGSGAPPPNTKPGAMLSATTVSLGAVTQGATASPQTVTVASTGTSTLHISSVVLGGSNAADITLNNGCSAGAYAVNAACNIGVAFSPLALGARSASITITDDAPDSPQTVTIAAIVNPALTITPASSGSTSASITAGQTANFNLLLTPGVGFIGSASFICAGAPAAANCAAPSVQIAGAVSLPLTIAVSTTAGGITIPRFQRPPFPPTQTLRPLPFWIAALLLLFLFFRATRRPPTCLTHSPLSKCAAASLLLAAMTIAGCGGGSAVTASVQSPPHVFTPQGSSTLTVTPTVTTSSGKQLPPLPAIQLTLTVN